MDDKTLITGLNDPRMALGDADYTLWGVAILKTSLRSALVAKEKAVEELGTERMRLAACGVAAMQNTVSTITERITPDNPYYSASYSDVCRAVDREMGHRAAKEKTERQLSDEKQKVANLEDYMLKGVAFRDELQGQLCKIKTVLSAYVPVGEWQNAIAALSSSAPCPHEEEAKWLRRELSVAVASAKAMVSNEMVASLEIIYKEEIVGCTEHEIAVMTRFMENFRLLARENREVLEAELRRRADAGREGK